MERAGFDVRGRFSFRDLLLLISFLGLGGHTYYAYTADQNLQQEIGQMREDLQKCRSRVDALEDLVLSQATPVPAIPIERRQRVTIAPDTFRRIPQRR